MINGVRIELLIHCKGATRTFPKNHHDIPEAYRKTRHPVLIPGTVRMASYIMVGTEEGMQQAFGSCAHGAGRSMSRTKQKVKFEDLQYAGNSKYKELLCIVCCNSDRELTEEAPLRIKMCMKLLIF